MFQLPGPQAGRKIALTVACCILLTSCTFAIPDLTNLTELIVGTSISPPGSATASPSPAPTRTPSPTQPTPTFTFTPTLVGAKSPTPSSVPTSSSTPILGATAITAASLTPTMNMDGLTEIKLSTSRFYSGSCQPDKVTFMVRVGDPARVAYVVLFARFKSTVTGNTGPWTSLTMHDLETGSFTYDLMAQEMEAFGYFDNPWVQYQLVTTDSQTRVLGRTQIFDERLSLTTDCKPTPTGTGTIAPTATRTP